MLKRATRRPVAADVDERTTLDAVLAQSVPVLEALPTNTFVDALDFTLVSANSAAHSTPAAIDGELRSTFGVSAHDIVGGSIHRFHRNPQPSRTSSRPTTAACRTGRGSASGPSSSTRRSTPSPTRPHHRLRRELGGRQRARAQLARSIAEATRGITEQITKVQGQVDRVVAALTEINDTIERSDVLQTSITSAVEQQSTATGQRSANVSGAAQRSGELVAALVQNR